MATRSKTKVLVTESKSALRAPAGYSTIRDEIVELLQSARQTSVQTVNALMTVTYWEIGRRIVEAEQEGKRRADYGDALVKRLADDLTAQFGRGFGVVNISQMRKFYSLWPMSPIFQTVYEKLALTESRDRKLQTLSEKSRSSIQSSPALTDIANRFPLPWSAYVRLLSVKSESARQFYEAEALRGGWSVRQLNRQVESLFYERTAMSRNKTAMLKKGEIAKPEDMVTPEEAIKDPYVLEFLNLKDEYSESQLEEALICRLEDFLLELGDDFTFVGRQRRLRIGDEWYRIDLLFFHRRLKSLVVIDLKIGKFTHADAGQMHLYLNYASEHWRREGENPPVGLILCAQKDAAVARYALEGLPNKILAAEYQMVLPDARRIAQELDNTRRALETRKSEEVKTRKKTQRKKS
jgi:predicted nuclease of restriction endonuclease-like (RecB) superfamily